MAIEKALLEILACPKCKGTLTCSSEEGPLTCLACRLAYPVRNHIPIMLIDEATPLNP